MGYNQYCCSTYLFHLDHSRIAVRHAVQGIGGERNRRHESRGISLWSFKGIFGLNAYLYVLLQVLRALERLSAEITFVRLQWDVDSDMGGDMITLDGGSTA